MPTIIIFVLVLSILIIVHELGHFVAAKVSGIKVEEFGLGLPPRILTIWKGDETIYTLNLLPLGGFVRLYGEVLTEADLTDSNYDKERSFYHKSHLAKIIVLSAGVIMNLVLAWLLTAWVILQLGLPVVDNSIFVQEVTASSPAVDVLAHGDIITGYRLSESQPEYTEVFDLDSFVSFVSNNAGSSLDLQITKDIETDSPSTTDITMDTRSNPPKGEGPLGVVIAEMPIVSYTPIEWWNVPYQATNEVFKMVVLMFGSLGKIVYDLVAHGIVPQDIAGPLGIAKITSEVAKEGLYPLIQFMAFISINLAVINILPFPALDGGRLVFIFSEIITGKKVSPHYEMWIHAGGMLLLIVLVALLSIYDFQRFY